VKFLNPTTQEDKRTRRYQYTAIDDVDLNKKVAIWEEFYDSNKLHGRHNGKIPYEAIRTMIE